jgi:hypothetical protein
MGVSVRPHAYTPISDAKPRPPEAWRRALDYP